MKKITLLTYMSAIAFASLIFFGCSDDTTTSPSTTYSVEGVIVDPYIVGAVLCEDVNLDGVCSGDEQNSSASTVDGVFKFENALQAQSHIMIQTQGMHEGKTYDLAISGVVTDDGTIDVISPLTTFETKGLTTTQIAEILNNAASDAGLTDWVISPSDITDNPLADNIENKTISDLSDADLVNIQASLASYGILKIMEGSDALSDLNSTELYYSGMQMNGHEELYQITLAMISNIAATLNTDTLDLVNGAIDSGRDALSASPFISDAKAAAGLPEPTADLIIKVAVSVIDRLAEIGYATCNETGGDVAAALGEVANNEDEITQKAISLGTQLYALRYHDSMKSEFSAPYTAALDGILSIPDMDAGYSANENGFVTIRFDSSNNLVAQ